MQTACQNSETKYTIRVKLVTLPGSITENTMRMCLHVGITLTTARRWIVAKKQDRFSIPVDQFYKLAEFFKCQPNDLINNG